MLMIEHFEKGYEYIFTHKLQSDPRENRFFHYRQMSGGRFLVSLREEYRKKSDLTVSFKRKNHFVGGRPQASTKE